MGLKSKYKNQQISVNQQISIFIILTLGHIEVMNSGAERLSAGCRINSTGGGAERPSADCMPIWGEG